MQILSFEGVTGGFRVENRKFLFLFEFAGREQRLATENNHEIIVRRMAVIICKRQQVSRALSAAAD